MKDVCSKCGHCPTCGRSNQYYWWQINPWYPTIPYGYPWYTYTSGSSIPINTATPTYSGGVSSNGFNYTAMLNFSPQCPPPAVDECDHSDGK